jgi:hypothetical protein
VRRGNAAAGAAWPATLHGLVADSLNFAAYRIIWLLSPARPARQAVMFCLIAAGAKPSSRRRRVQIKQSRVQVEHHDRRRVGLYSALASASGSRHGRRRQVSILGRKPS